MKLTFLDAFEARPPFTEHEAWRLFTISAIGEAVGWTLLIGGIALGHTQLPFHDYGVPLAGSVHGLLFLTYAGLAAATYSSLGWPRWQAVVAILASVPPYGSLAFELWAARRRRRGQQQTYRRIVVSARITQGKTVLAIQPSERAQWRLPGGEVRHGETPQQALGRILHQLMGITAPVGPIHQIVARPEDQLELIFDIGHTQPLRAADLARLRTQPGIDEADFVPITSLT